MRCASGVVALCILQSLHHAHAVLDILTGLKLLGRKERRYSIAVDIGTFLSSESRRSLGCRPAPRFPPTRLQEVRAC